MNENCLEGMQCPKCKVLEPFRIRGEAFFTVRDSGSDTFTELDWESTSRCGCITCVVLRGQ